MQSLKAGILALGLLSGSALANEALIVRFNLTDSIKSYLRANEFDILGVNYETNEIEALLTQEEFALISAQKANFKFAFPENLAAAPDSEYQNPEEIEDFIQEVHANYPDITEVKIIGKTLEGRDIHAIKISDNAATDEVEPAVLFNGMHHAREIMTPEITTDIVSYLTSNYASNAEVKKWVDGSEIWIIPMFNLDGNNKMWDGNSMWRKNTRGGFGVDLNRNYPSGWNSCNGSSSSTGAQDYRGTAPASEPETQAMMNFVAEIKPVFDISYHSYSELVIYPYGCRPRRTPTEEAVEIIGKEVAQKINYKPGTAWELLYNADGGDIDWMYTEHQVIPFVIEVNSTSQGFHPSYKQWRDVTVARNRPGWQHLLNRLSGTSIQGQAPADYNVIKFYKPGTTTLTQSYKINPDHSFYVMLKAGKYDVVFEGTQTKRFDGVDVSSRTALNF